MISLSACMDVSYLEMITDRVMTQTVPRYQLGCTPHTGMPSQMLHHESSVRGPQSSSSQSTDLRMITLNTSALSGECLSTCSVIISSFNLNLTPSALARYSRAKQEQGGLEMETFNSVSYTASRVAHLLLYPDAWHRLGHPHPQLCEISRQMSTLS